jgi:hypothetical protein
MVTTESVVEPTFDKYSRENTVLLGDLQIFLAAAAKTFVSEQLTAAKGGPTVEVEADCLLRAGLSYELDDGRRGINFLGHMGVVISGTAVLDWETKTWKLVAKIDI